MGPQPVVAVLPTPVSSRTHARARLRRSLGVAGCALALACAGAAYPAPPARADDRAITAADQPYFAHYHLDVARQKGYTGRGVTIALIDGRVDTTVPELAGANISDRSPCTVESSASHTSHGTGLASLLVARDYGVVPDAILLSYRNLGSDSNPGQDCALTSRIPLSNLSSMINHAINDGASIINFSSASGSHENDLKWAIARAMSQGVLITTAVGNSSKDDNDTSLSWWSGVIGVSAIDIDGAFASYSSWGQGVTTTAIGGPFTARSIRDNKTIHTQGTSVSAPIVAGILAQARAKWPQATANQLLQSLVRTAVGHEQGWNQYGGYGAINPGAMLNTDPTQFPDENPLADKGGGTSPTPAEVQLYADGLVEPSEVAYDDSYAYRGLDEFQLTSQLHSYPVHLGTSPRYHAK